MYVICYKCNRTNNKILNYTIYYEILGRRKRNGQTRSEKRQRSRVPLDGRARFREMGPRHCANTTEGTDTDPDGPADRTPGCAVQPGAPGQRVHTASYCTEVHMIKSGTRKNDKPRAAGCSNTFCSIGKFLFISRKSTL